MRSLDDLTMYVYGLLDGAAEIEIREHARACADCSARIDRIALEHRLLARALPPRGAGSSARSERPGRLRR